MSEGNSQSSHFKEETKAPSCFHDSSSLNDALIPMLPPPLPPVGSTNASPVASTQKKRGRPRKPPMPEGEAPPKRKRGRPRKSETEAKAAAEGATAGSSPAGTDTQKNKRGRPKKEPGSEGPPKKRGRPRKTIQEGDAKTADTTPKKRGRPRKGTGPTTPGAAPGVVGPAPTTSVIPLPLPVHVQTAPTVHPVIPTGTVAPSVGSSNAHSSSETKESDTIREPRMDSRKRRRNVSASPVEKNNPKKKSARKLKFTTEKEKDKVELDFDNLEKYSLSELSSYAREQNINKSLRGNRKSDYIHAMLLKQLSQRTVAQLKTEAEKRGVDMKDYGSTNKRKIDYIHAIIDDRLGEGEPLWSLWKEIYLVGTEWENYDAVFDINWDFDHLKEALDESGELNEAGAKHPVYLFGVTEPQLVEFGEGDRRVTPIPAIVALISPLPPPAELGIKSVQKVEEEFVPMRDLKMDWVPYIPKSTWKSDPKSVVPRAFFLKTFQRREGLKDMKEEELVKFNFALPYIFLPRAQEAPTFDDTIVTVVTEVNGRGTSFEFDWTDMDEVDEFAEGVLKDHGLDPKENQAQLEALIEEIKNTVSAEKARIRAAKAAWQAKLDALGPEKRKALDELKIWKYYPQNEHPDISGNKVSYVNRYYGKADRVL